jgi:PAS domain S-box-containing protein
LSILDFGLTKVQTVITIVYRIIREYCEASPKSLRLWLFKAYFELYIMRKKYLAHQTLTRLQGEDFLGLLAYTEFQLDQQYLVEKASTLYQTKEDQLIDVEKIIQQNYHYQNFHDLNEETAFSFNSFWTQLANPKNIDIEKLFQTGLKTSELVKQTKDKFQLLVTLGIDKRNSQLYYMYANFNLFVLNSVDLYQEYIGKMEQISNMNKTLLENTYKEQLNSDVDKSGFLLVKGNFVDFGKIIYANKHLCQMLGYTQEQVNGADKVINILMPTIISDQHHIFMNIFRETGLPTFIQRQQQLFIKNASGYIMPFKCYIKFHYDKQFGHVFCAIINKTT